MGHDRRVLVLVGLLAGVAPEAREASAEDIACLPMTSGQTYSFEKVLDAAAAFPLDLIPNDRGHALIRAVPEAGVSSGTCLLVHRGATTEPLVCTRDIDATSPFTSIGGASTGTSAARSSWRARCTRASREPAPPTSR